MLVKLPNGDFVRSEDVSHVSVQNASMDFGVLCTATLSVCMKDGTTLVSSLLAKDAVASSHAACEARERLYKELTVPEALWYCPKCCLVYFGERPTCMHCYNSLPLQPLRERSDAE